MTLRLLGYVDLPASRSTGGFDHADVHAASHRLYVAHTANDALDIIDCEQDRCIGSVEGLAAVAGALVSDAHDLVFTSNRGENTVSVFAPGKEREAVKIEVGIKPNGLAFDPLRGILIAANVGDPAIPDSYSVSVIDIAERKRIAEIPMPGRTRWAVYDASQERFFVNIASPALIVAIDARKPHKVAGQFAIPAAGPHGLDLDSRTGRLYCACDAGRLLAIDAASGRVQGDIPLSGAPDVIFLGKDATRLYVAIGDPGVIDVIDTVAMKRAEIIATEADAHTLAIDRKRGKVYAFLPGSHRAAVFAEVE